MVEDEWIKEQRGANKKEREREERKKDRKKEQTKKLKKKTAGANDKSKLGPTPLILLDTITRINPFLGRTGRGVGVRGEKRGGGGVGKGLGSPES